MVAHVDDKEQFTRFLTEASNRPDGPGLIVVDFFATWCRPCSEIAPLFNSLSVTYADVRFVKVDVDKNESVAADYKVSTIPTFIFLRGDKEVDRLLGAQPDVLQAKLRMLTKQQKPTDASSQSAERASQSAEAGSQSAGHSGSSQPDLAPFLDRTQCECLNEDDTHPLSHLLNPEMVNAYLLSDTDAQLIIFITFSQFVRLRSIQINGPEDCGPKTLKLFLNQTSTPDFGACESATAVQTLTLEPKDLENGAIVPLNFVKFQNVTTITVFVADNQTGADVTRIDNLRFYGSCVNTTNMQHFKRVAGKPGEGHS